MNGQHLDDSVIADHALAHSGEETVPCEVVHPVHIQLAADQLVQEHFRVGVGEYADGCVQRAIEHHVQASHHKQRYLLVMHILDQHMFEGVGEGAMADVMQEDGDLRACFLIRCQLHALSLQF